ncbi:MAG: hypothetical protein WBM32_08120, partial [Crocosphaera sp.]
SHLYPTVSFLRCQVLSGILGTVLVYCGIKHNPYEGGWVMNSQDALDLLSEDQELTKDSLRVLLKLCAKLDFENWIQISQIDVCNQLQLNKSNVSKALKLLVSKGILLQGPKAGRSFAYRLNPNYGWKGKVKNLNEYRQQVEEQETLKFRKP